jgi:hypothetical protein
MESRILKGVEKGVTANQLALCRRWTYKCKRHQTANVGVQSLERLTGFAFPAAKFCSMAFRMSFLSVPCPQPSDDVAGSSFVSQVPQYLAGWTL